MRCMFDTNFQRDKIKTHTMAKENIHVLYRKDGMWEVKREHREKPSAVFDNKEKAIKEGRRAAKKDKVEFIIHNSKNQIARKDSYGNDPYPPKDKKH